MFISSALFIHNNTVSETTGYKPSYLMYLRDINLPIDLDFIQPTSQLMDEPDYVTIMTERLATVYKKARLQIKYSQEQYKEQYDKNAKPHDFKVGDKVRIWTPTTKKGLSPKLSRPYKGPYEVVRVTPTNLFIIKNKNSDPIVVHANRCKKAEIEPTKRYNLRSNTQSEICVIELQSQLEANRIKLSPEPVEHKSLNRVRTASIPIPNTQEEDSVLFEDYVIDTDYPQNEDTTERFFQYHNDLITLQEEYPGTDINNIAFRYARGDIQRMDFRVKIYRPDLFLAKNEQGNMPIQEAIQRGKFHKAMKLLPTKTEDLYELANSQNKDGQTTLMMAIFNRAPFSTTIKTLIAYSDLNIADNEEKIAYHYSVEKGNRRIQDILDEIENRKINNPEERLKLIRKNISRYQQGEKLARMNKIPRNNRTFVLSSENEKEVYIDNELESCSRIRGYHEKKPDAKARKQEDKIRRKRVIKRSISQEIEPSPKGTTDELYKKEIIKSVPSMSINKCLMCFYFLMIILIRCVSGTGTIRMNITYNHISFQAIPNPDYRTDVCFYSKCYRYDDGVMNIKINPTSRELWMENQIRIFIN